MTRLVKFDASVAGYGPGQVVDLDEVDDPRVAAAVEAGYAQRVTRADVEEGTVILDQPPAPDGPVTLPDADPAPPAGKRGGGRQKAT
jgi:hypothetical protein